MNNQNNLISVVLGVFALFLVIGGIYFYMNTSNDADPKNENENTSNAIVKDDANDVEKHKVLKPPVTDDDAEPGNDTDSDPKGSEVDGSTQDADPKTNQEAEPSEDDDPDKKETDSTTEGSDR